MTGRGILTPGLTDRLLVLGPTGSGKSEFMRDMIARCEDPRMTTLVVDPKRQWKISKADGDILVDGSLWKLETVLDKDLERERGAIVYRPPRQDLARQNAANLDHVAKLALERTWTRLVYDEVKYVAGASDFEARAPFFFYSITTGRSSHVPVWMGCQRPAWIPLVCLSESDLRATFYLRMRADRGRAEELLGDDVPWNDLRRNRWAFVMATDRERSNVKRLNFADAPKGKAA